MVVFTENNARKPGDPDSFWFYYHGLHMQGGRYYDLSIEADGLLGRLKIWATNGGSLLDKSGKPYSKEELYKLCNTSRKKFTRVLKELEDEGHLGWVEVQHNGVAKSALFVNDFHFDQSDKSYLGRLKNSKSKGTIEVSPILPLRRE